VKLREPWIVGLTFQYDDPNRTRSSSRASCNRRPHDPDDGANLLSRHVAEVQRQHQRLAGLPSPRRRELG
jgi:hypothetical protein